MTIRWLLAALHLLALGIGLGAVWARAVGLRRFLDTAGLKRVFYADNFWGGAAALWLVTGLLRAFAGFEKGTSYYVHNHLFQAKMTLFVIIFALELRPMMALINWRRAQSRGQQVTPLGARSFGTISFVQAALLVLMVVLATGMARGYGG